MILRGRATALALALGLTAFTAGVARAQSGSITIAAGNANSANIATRAQFTVPLIVDMSNASGLNLASLVTKVTWTHGRFALDSIRSGAFGSIQSTIDSAAASASVAVFNATGTSATTTIANLYFTAGTSTAGSRISLAPTVAGNDVGASITNRLRGRGLDVCVAPQTPWGDANGDGTVDILDAQQIARFVIGLSVANPSALVSGDVTADGKLDIVDAQQVALSAVGLPASARIGTMASLVPTVTGVSIQPGTLDVGVGHSMQLLAVPVDAGGTPLIGCTPLNWATTDSSIAVVDVNGIVSGGAIGAATITATAIDGTNGTLALTVSDPIATLTMSRDTATIHLGEQLTLSAIARGAGGSTLGTPITFSSSDPSIATVSATGGQVQVTGVNVGPVTITATAQGKTATTSMQISPLAVNALATGDDFSCVLSVAGAAYCWGSDSTYQLGDGRTINRNTPVPAAVPASLRFTQIIAANKGACALSTTRTVYCWGARFESNGFQTPAQVSGSLQVKSMAGYGSSADGGLCMTDVGGTTHCLGDGSRGQMGTGVRQSNSLLTNAPVLGGPFESITAGQYVVCGLAAQAAYCWGGNVFGGLGTGDPDDAALPVPVAGGLSFLSIAAGRSVTCGVVATSFAGYCWGTGYFGNDGDGDVTLSTHAAPNPISPSATDGTTLSFQGVWPGGSRDVSPTCGLTLDGTAYCWGSNSNGQLGALAPLPSPSCVSGMCGAPMPVASTSKFATIRPGGEHVCGITTDHVVLCWGSNVAGQLGDGSNTRRWTPVAIAGSVRVP